MLKEFLCLKECATVLGIDVKTMKKILDNTTEIKRTRLGRKILINKKHLLEFMATHRNIRY